MKHKKHSISNFSNKIDLSLIERSPIFIKNIMEPNFRHRAALLAAPRENSLSPAKHKPPINGPDLFSLHNGQMSLKLRVNSPGHILAAN
jgi:hypothetical protein